MIGYKIIAGVASAGIVVIGTYGIYDIFNPVTILDSVQKNNLILLNTKLTKDSETNSDDETWKTKVSSWKENEGVAKFIGKELKDKEEKDKIAALKEKCQQTLGETYESEKYKNFEAYCIKTNQESSATTVNSVTEIQS